MEIGRLRNEATEQCVQLALGTALLYIILANRR